MNVALYAMTVALQTLIPVHLDSAKLGPPDWEAQSIDGMTRAYYFGGDNHTLSGATGEVERYIDPSYCAVPDTVTSNPEGGFTITARPATPSDRELCHLKSRELYVSGLVSTQHLFSSTYGYWVMRARLPSASASWPAFWLLPTAKTAENRGAIPEIDILEEYAGVRQGVPDPTASTAQRAWTLDRTGFPISSLHLAGGKTLSGGQTVHIEPETWHTFGLLWEPTHLTFFVDEVRTWDVDIAISDPHYLIINLGVDGRNYLGPFDYPASMDVSWVRHYPLAKSPADPAN